MASRRKIRLYTRIVPSLIPLPILTRRRDIMGIDANTRLTNLLAYASAFVILALNALLIAHATGLKF